MPGKTVKEEEETSWKLLIMFLIFFCPVKVFNTECQNIMFKIFQWSLYTSALLYTATTSYCRSTLWKSHLAKQFLHPKWVIQLKLLTFSSQIQDMIAGVNNVPELYVSKIASQKEIISRYTMSYLCYSLLVANVVGS